MLALGIYREVEFSPGKVEADKAILDAVLSVLEREGFEVRAIEPARLWERRGEKADLILAMCQGERALRWLAARQSGAVTLNSALSIRNCYRDLMGPGLERAGVPIPPAALVGTAAGADARSLSGIDLSRPLYVKRGGLHALEPDDVIRVVGLDELRAALAGFARRAIPLAYVQEEVEGTVLKFYGVSGGEYFAAPAERGAVAGAIETELASAASAAATALGLDAWGGDAIIEPNGRMVIIDFNDWPSYSRVREPAARAIARRATQLVRQRARGANPREDSI